MTEGSEEERSSAGDRRSDGGFNLQKLGFEITEKLLTKQPQPHGTDRQAPGEQTQEVQTKEQKKRKEADKNAEAGSGMFDNLGRDLVGRLLQQDEEARRLSLVQRRTQEEGQEALLKLGRNVIQHTTAVVENIENKELQRRNQEVDHTMTAGRDEGRSSAGEWRADGGFNLQKLGFEITEKLLTKQPQPSGTDRQAHGEQTQEVQTKEQKKRKEADKNAEAGSGMFDNLGRDLVGRLLQQDEEARRLSLVQRRTQEEGQEALLKLGRNVIQHTTAVVENIENKELQRRNQEVGHTMTEGRDEGRSSAGEWRADGGFNLQKLGFEITEKLLTKQPQPSGRDRQAHGEQTQEVQTKEQKKRKEEDINAEAGSGMFDNLGRDLVGRLWQQDEEARRLSLVREAALKEMQRRNQEEGQETLLKLGRNLIHHTTAVVENMENKSKNALPTQEDASKGLPASLKELEQREFAEGKRSSLLDAFGRDLFQHTTAVVENFENTTKSVLPRRPSADECQDEPGKAHAWMHPAELKELEQRREEEGTEALLKLGHHILQHTTAVVENIGDTTHRVLDRLPSKAESEVSLSGASFDGSLVLETTCAWCQQMSLHTYVPLIHSGPQLPFPRKPQYECVRCSSFTCPCDYHSTCAGLAKRQPLWDEALCATCDDRDRAEAEAHLGFIATLPSSNLRSLINPRISQTSKLVDHVKEQSEQMAKNTDKGAHIMGMVEKLSSDFSKLSARGKGFVENVASQGKGLQREEEREATEEDSSGRYLHLMLDQIKDHSDHFLKGMGDHIENLSSESRELLHDSDSREQLHGRDSTEHLHLHPSKSTVEETISTPHYVPRQGLEMSPSEPAFSFEDLSKGSLPAQSFLKLDTNSPGSGCIMAVARSPGRQRKDEWTGKIEGSLSLSRDLPMQGGSGSSWSPNKALPRSPGTSSVVASGGEGASAQSGGEGASGERGAHKPPSITMLKLNLTNLVPPAAGVPSSSSSRGSIIERSPGEGTAREVWIREMQEIIVREWEVKQEAEMEPWEVVRDILLTWPTSPEKEHIGCCRHLLEQQVFVERWLRTSNRGGAGKVEETIRRLIKHVAWRYQYKVDSILEEDWAAYDARNEMFVAGLDRQGRPSVTWRVSRHEPDQPAGQTPALGARYLVCTIERARAVNPSSRHIIFICDCSGLQWKNFEHAMFTEAVGMLQENYPDNVAHIFLFPVGWLINSLIGVCRPLLDKDTAKKMSVLTEENVERGMREHFDEEEIEVRLGGQLDIQKARTRRLAADHPLRVMAGDKASWQDRDGCGVAHVWLYRDMMEMQRRFVPPKYEHLLLDTPRNVAAKRAREMADRFYTSAVSSPDTCSHMLSGCPGITPQMLHGNSRAGSAYSAEELSCTSACSASALSQRLPHDSESEPAPAGEAEVVEVEGGGGHALGWGDCQALRSAPAPLQHAHAGGGGAGALQVDKYSKDTRKDNYDMAVENAPVHLRITLGLDFSIAGSEGSDTREKFKRDVAQDLAAATDLFAANFRIEHVSAGSIILGVQVMPDLLAPGKHVLAAKDLAKQAGDASSKLRSGKITRRTLRVDMPAATGGGGGLEGGAREPAADRACAAGSEGSEGSACTATQPCASGGWSTSPSPSPQELWTSTVCGGARVEAGEGEADEGESEADEGEGEADEARGKGPAPAAPGREVPAPAAPAASVLALRAGGLPPRALKAAKATREKAAVASGSSDANCPAPPPPSSTVANALLFLLITLVSTFLYKRLGDASRS